MTETAYTVGSPGEMPEIIDFINYVFSQTARPHDFKTLLPKVYGDSAPEEQEAFHFLAKQNGKLVGCVACRPTLLKFGGETLSCGYIGSVSVHKYHRGEGHMKKLMAMAIRDARSKGYDMLILGGQRQRYGYFGFEPAGMALRFQFTKTNARHVLKDVDISEIALRSMTEADVSFAMELWQRQPVSSLRREITFLDDLRSWAQTPLCITVGGEPVGYCAGDELILQDESLMPKVLKAITERSADFALSLVAGLHEKQRIAYLSGVCEGVTLGSKAQINVLNWPRVLKIFIEFKHRFVRKVNDCAFTLDIAEDGTFAGNVKNGNAEIEALSSVPASAIRLGHNEAQRLFFGIGEAALDGGGIDPGCRALPFYMSGQDGF